MGYEDNVYYYPEKHGLTQVGLLEDPMAGYDFEILAVWRHEDGRLFWASDSGCSCPSPFEAFDGVKSLHEITPATWAEFEKGVGEWLEWRTEDDTTQASRTELLAKISRMVKR